MSHKNCEVARTALELGEALKEGKLVHPRARYRAEELLSLLDDVSCGRGGFDHYEAMTFLAASLVEEGPDESTRAVGSAPTNTKLMSKNRGRMLNTKTLRPSSNVLLGVYFMQSQYSSVFFALLPQIEQTS